MNRNTISSSKMVSMKSKVASCSTPEYGKESPTRDSDSLCDSEAASPVPFLCTQDGAEGDVDVVWSFYTPKAENAPGSRLKNSTPLSRKSKKTIKHNLIERPLPKRKTVKPQINKNTELFQDLIELNQNLHELITKKSKGSTTTDKQSGSEEDIFSDSGDNSPKSGLKGSSRCLRRNLLSSKFGKPETDTALESDDSINDCLIKASQVVEENILNYNQTSAKQKHIVSERNNIAKNVDRSHANVKMDHDSMDVILSSIKLDSPFFNKSKKAGSPALNNDSFDSFVGNLNDSALEKLTQLPIKQKTDNRSKFNNSKDGWTVQELVDHNGSPSSKLLFGRHNSMPESPTVTNTTKPSTSGMVFGRYSSMPYNQHDGQSIVPGDSPIRCTPDEIKKKHQQAREKLLAKRLLPFTSTQTSSQPLSTSPTEPQTKQRKFQPRVASASVNNFTTRLAKNGKDEILPSSNSSEDLKVLIEKKRQDALMRLRRRQPSNK